MQYHTTITVRHLASDMCCVLVGICRDAEGRIWLHTLHRPRSPHVLPLQRAAGLGSRNPRPAGGGVYRGTGRYQCHSCDFSLQSGIIFKPTAHSAGCATHGLCDFNLFVHNGMRNMRPSNANLVIAIT